MNESVSVLSIRIGQQIAEVMEQKKLTAKDIVTDLGMTERSFAYIVEGVWVVDIIELIRIADALDVKIDSLVPNRKWLEENKNKKVKKRVTYELE